MTYLLDVNALIALAHRQHIHHEAMIGWYTGLSARDTRLSTCSITELGFVRVSVQVKLQPDVEHAKRALAKLKESSRVPFGLLSDDLGADLLPAFANSPARVTDGHLLLLARRHAGVLATLDRGIPGSVLIT